MSFPRPQDPATTGIDLFDATKFHLEKAGQIRAIGVFLFPMMALAGIFLGCLGVTPLVGTLIWVGLTGLAAIIFFVMVFKGFYHTLTSTYCWYYKY